MKVVAAIDPADELLVAREARGLRWSFLARLVFLTFISIFRIFAHVDYRDLIAGFVICGAGIILCLVALRAARQRRSLALLSVKGVAFDLLMLAGAPIGIWLAHPAEAPMVLAKSELGLIGVVFIVINGLSMRPLYPALVTAGAVLEQIVLLTWALTAGRVHITSDLLVVYSSDHVYPLLLVARTGILLTVGTGVSFLAAAARNMVRDAVALERANQNIQAEQAELINEGKINALGHLVAGIAHEVNSPLGAMISGAGTVTQVKARLEQDVRPLLPEPHLERSLSVLGDAAQAITEGGKRIGDLVVSLRSFSHHEHADRARVDLREGLESALRMVPESVRSKIEVVRDFQEVHLECEPRALNQVFLTLILNACEAMKGEGRLTLAVRAEEKKAIVEIADSGPGIPADRLANLFELVFSAKRRVGMGLGLPTARHVLANHGGRIEVESPSGGGARFRLSLPIHQ